jgi:IS5 family transposase
VRRRSAIEAVIGHMKADGHLDSCYLGRAGDASNVILPAVGHNCRLVLAWLRDVILARLLPRPERVILTHELMSAMQQPDKER